MIASFYAFSSSAEEHRATTVEETAVRIGSDPTNNFIVGAFLDGELVGTAGFYRERGLKVQHKGHVWACPERSEGRLLLAEKGVRGKARQPLSPPQHEATGSAKSAPNHQPLTERRPKRW